jgi:hypothetical protein
MVPGTAPWTTLPIRKPKEGMQAYLAALLSLVPKHGVWEGSRGIRVRLRDLALPLWLRPFTY